MASPADRIEQKLARVLAERYCEICETRVEACPSCGRPVGGLPGEAEAVRHRVTMEIERLAVRRKQLQGHLDAVE